MSPDLNFVERAILKHELKKWIGGMSQMKLSWNLVFQGLAMVAQGANFLSGIVPAKYQPLVTIAVSTAQGLVAWHAHNVNPDGTPAQVAYTKK